MKKVNNDFLTGVKHGIPIGLGYLSVSFTFGMMAVSAGIPALSAVLISMTNLTSAGQFAGLLVITGSGSFFELILGQIVINLRYALMSFSLSQKLDDSVNFLDRLIMSFGNTDEIFAVASSQEGTIGRTYFLGLMLMPYIGWAFGTFLGAYASLLLPEVLTSALGIAIYGMFLAIIIPPSKRAKNILIVVLTAAIFSCAFNYLPGLNLISQGFVIIICSILASVIGALLFPVKKVEEE